MDVDKHTYNFYENGRPRATLICSEEDARGYVDILCAVTYSVWSARRQVGDA